MDESEAPSFLRFGAVALLALHVAYSVAPALVGIRNDFVNYYVTARARFEGRSLDRAYERTWLEAERARSGIPTLGFFIPNPPANALLLLPVAGLGPYAAKAVWSAFLALCLLLSFLTLRRAVTFSPWLLALVFLVPSASIRNALLYGPPYPLLLLFLSLALLAGLRGRDFVSGLLLAPAVALKLYGLVFLPYFLLRKRFRAAAGLLAGLVLLTSLSVGLLGAPIHSVYVKEMLRPSLTGRVLDPYSANWQSLASVSRRLLEREEELNPSPLTDRPALAEGLAAGLPAGLMFLALICTKREEDASALKGNWAILSLASLTASSLPATYHFVLLALPVALLLDGEDNPASRWMLLGVHAFCTSSLPHYFASWAHGWLNLLAVPRLWALGLLFAAALAVHGAMSPLRALMALAVAGVVALGAPSPGAEPWQRIAAAHGLISAEPMACGGELAWVTTQGESYVVRTSGGRTLAGVSPRCRDGRLVTGDVAFETAEAFGHPRLSPDGAWIAYQSFGAGSWDIWALERATGRMLRLTHDSANEVEPAWSASGEAVYFASDRRRGLGGTALYVIPFPPKG